MIIFLSAASVQSARSQYVIFKNEKQQAKIKNNGTLRIRSHGAVHGMPDTIGGRVEFTSDKKFNRQIVPNSTYYQLLIYGQTRRYVDTAEIEAKIYNPLTALDSLIFKKTEVVVDSIEVHAKASVKNEEKSDVEGKKDVRLNREVSSQTLEGNGDFSRINIDNPHGVDIINGGGFSVNNKLELTRGELRNSDTDNFNLADSIRIIRHVGASLAYDPTFEGDKVSVHYVGAGKLTSGPETPYQTDSTGLRNLYVSTTEGIDMGRDVTVNDTLYLASRVNTEESGTFTLTYTDTKDPIFDHKDAEIDGNFRRTSILLNGSKVLFNNPYTYIKFDQQPPAGISEITFRVKPKTFPHYPAGTEKVHRFIQITAKDNTGNDIQDNLQAELGYGWRITDNKAKDETNNLPVPELVLERWNGSTWMSNEQSEVPTVDSTLEWAFSHAPVSTIGDFAIGKPGGLELVLRSKVWLEGPFRYGSMANDLTQKGLIPNTPPDIYPYNLDPRRPFIHVDQIPDSVVDWVLLEFRPEFTSQERYYRTAFLRMDGKIVDLDGISPVLLDKGNIDSGSYFIAIRHRNHLAIITENKVGIYPETVGRVLDFSNPANIMGRQSALKPIGFDQTGSLLYGMYGGDVNADGRINETDRISIWDSRDIENIYHRMDIRMNGIITTRDLNVSWNNRGEQTNIP